MKNGSMFADLDRWAEQSFYDGHPVMWLITPETVYKVLLFSSYTTSAGSDAYQIFTDPGPALDEYVKTAAARSDFKSDASYNGERCVMLSTCAYDYNDARRVLHGLLIPQQDASGRV